MWARVLEIVCQMYVIICIKYVIKLCTFIFAWYINCYILLHK